MNAQRAAGWVAVISGALLAVGLVGSAVASAAGVPGTSGWTAMMSGGATGTMMGNGMMGNGMMGNGVMGNGMMGNGMMGAMPHGKMSGGMMGFGTSGPASTPIPNAPEVKVATTNFALTPNEIRLPKSADVNLTLVNGTGVVHDLTVPALGIHVVANPGETKTVGLRALPAGRYDAYCSVPGHADLGMRAAVIVE